MTVEWILCPICGNKTCDRIRENTVLRKYPLYCPKCKKETFQFLLAVFLHWIPVLFNWFMSIYFRQRRISNDVPKNRCSLWFIVKFCVFFIRAKIFQNDIIGKPRSSKCLQSPAAKNYRCPRTGKPLKNLEHIQNLWIALCPNCLQGQAKWTGTSFWQRMFRRFGHWYCLRSHDARGKRVGAWECNGRTVWSCNYQSSSAKYLRRWPAAGFLSDCRPLRFLAWYGIICRLL